MPRITVKRLVLAFLVIATMLLYLMLIQIIPVPFNISPHEPTTGYKYVVGDINIGSFLEYSYTYEPQIESVYILIIDKSLTSITCNVTTTYRNENIENSKQIWYVGDWKFANDTKVSYPTYTKQFLREGFIAGNLDVNDKLYSVYPTDKPVIIGKKKLEIWNIGYREVLEYQIYLRSYVTGLMQHTIIKWDRETGVVLYVDVFTDDLIMQVDLVDTNLFEPEWNNPYLYLAYYHFVFRWIWFYIIYTKIFVVSLILWITSFVVIAGWDKTQRGGWGSGLKRWMPFLIVIVLANIIMIFLQRLLIGGAGFFGS